MSTLNDYKNKGVIITGASSGMGLELAKLYAAKGANLELLDIDEQALSGLDATCKQLGAGQVRCVPLDVSNLQAYEAYAKDARDHLPSIDVLINNAGIAQIGFLDEVPMEDYRRIIEVNFFGVLYGTKLFIEDLKKTKGRLVNTSSIFGMVGVAGNSAYCASKFAVKGLNESLWLEAPAYGISVTSVHPGGIKTNIVRKAQVLSPDTPNDVAEQFDAIAKTTASSAAEQIFQAADNRKKRLVIGSDGKFVVGAQRWFPLSYTKLLGFFGVLGSSSRLDNNDKPA